MFAITTAVVDSAIRSHYIYHCVECHVRVVQPSSHPFLQVLVKMLRLLTPEESAADHQRRTSEVLDRAAAKKVAAIIKRHPNAATKAYQHLRDLGYDVNNDSHVTLASRKLSHAQQLGSKKQQQSQDNQQIDDSSEQIPIKYQYVFDLPVDVLCRRVLCVLEKSSMSCANLRNFTQRAGRGAAKAQLHKLFELATGQEPDLKLDNGLDSWSLLLRFLTQESLRRGRRTAEIDFTDMDFSRQGIFQLSLCGQQRLWVTQRFTQQSKQAPFDRTWTPEQRSRIR